MGFCGGKKQLVWAGEAINRIPKSSLGLQNSVRPTVCWEHRLGICLLSCRVAVTTLPEKEQRVAGVSQPGQLVHSGNHVQKA